MAKSKVLSASSSLSSKRKSYPVWFYGVLWLLPILFFAALEGGLRLFGYGDSYPIFVPFEHNPSQLRLNPRIPEKYFGKSAVTPSTILDVFDKVKAPNALRVFILGESSAAGWPYPPAVAFSSTLRRALQALYPERKIEVINLGIAAICTYTLKDFLPAVLEHQPDLVIFYNGHNEYYGVLGVGSSMRLGSSRWLTNLRLALRDLRLYQLLQNLFSSAARALSSRSSEDSGTLMARVIGESAIAYNSDTYRKGLEQFEAHLDEMLGQLEKAGVPTLVGTLVSNYRDQPPFVSLDESPNAQMLFQQARAALQAGDSLSAKSLFLQAKDLDALRFRAPEAMNEIIRNLAIKHHATVAEIQQGFERASPFGIVGNSLMCDHLHPTVHGYQLMGKIFLQTALEHHLLPPHFRPLPPAALDSLLFSPVFSPLDATIADLKLRLLKGSYPFVPKGEPNRLLLSFRPQTLVDTLAMRVVSEELTIEEAHYAAADYFLAQRDTLSAQSELQSFISKLPFLELPYRKAGQLFIKYQLFDRALPYLLEAYRLSPTLYSTKWIGQILLYQHKIPEAIAYLERSLSLGGQSDSQLYYNLAGAYYQANQLEKALQALQRC
ncbi:MAG: hypothetical protein NZ844_07295, partial [Chloroherpetonaceae bacterium]|nr:hypothetical protein [Chloroherpetonaceae bacterium]